MRGRLGWVLGVLAIVAIAALFLRDRLTAISSGQVAQAVYLLLALLLVGGVFAGRGARLGPAPVRNALIWLCVVLALMLAYSALSPAWQARFF